MSTELKANEFYTTRRGDNRKSPEMVKVMLMTYNDLKMVKAGNHVNVLDRAGKLAQVKITSVKTWKRKSDIEIHCKYGMYEYFDETITPDFQQKFFVKVIND